MTATKRPYEADLESPGYDFLRSFQNMSQLHQKLLALNYQRDFCTRYKCPPIHRYYFSLPAKNAGEQQFIFVCLCAWLIKDKCQLNFAFEPEDYEEPEVTLGAIMDAIKLLLVADDDIRGQRNFNASLGFPASRLKTGFGPETIWALSVLADRAIELLLVQDSAQLQQVRPVYCTNSSSPSSGLVANRRSGPVQGANSVTIGQPFVGGGLTTRPLGTYKVEDPSLELEASIETAPAKQDAHIEPSVEIDAVSARGGDLDQNEPLPSATEWLKEAEHVPPRLLSSEHDLEANGDDDDGGTLVASNCAAWAGELEAARSRLGQFKLERRAQLETAGAKIERQLQLIYGRERALESKLGTKLANFLRIWKEYSGAEAAKSELTGQIETKTDKFDAVNESIRELGGQVESRLAELSDGSRLSSLEQTIGRLRNQDAKLEFNVGLLLALYAKKHAKLVQADA